MDLLMLQGDCRLSGNERAATSVHCQLYLDYVCTNHWPPNFLCKIQKFLGGWFKNLGAVQKF